MSWEILLRNSYTPYSHQREACVITGTNGIYPGVRVENIAYPQSITALQGALGLCLSCGDHPMEILHPTQRLQHPSVDEHTWRKWLEAQGWGTKWKYSDDLSAEVEEGLSDLRNPLTVIRNQGSLHETEMSEKTGFKSNQLTESIVETAQVLTSLFLDAVQPVYDKARRRLLTELTSLAFIPHSDFPVSALLETDKGLIGGVNVEFEIWNFGLCAERNAIHTAIAYGARPTGSIAVFAPKSQLCSPCGMCRQTLAEWPLLERVLLYHGDGSSSEHRIEDLLPLHFQATTLGSGS